ncbi:MAG: hypothetical protein DMG14_00370 [Acidobacteria bacterium]|nr:MAG: hypothetical protein DMG14_00370 [Acidobacteriota bacterium]
MYHWTDSMIRVHVFYCVLALTIASLLVRQLHLKGIDISIPRLFDLLKQIYELALIWPRGPGRTSRQQGDSFQLSETGPERKKSSKPWISVPSHRRLYNTKTGDDLLAESARNR